MKIKENLFYIIFYLLIVLLIYINPPKNDDPCSAFDLELKTSSFDVKKGKIIYYCYKKEE